VRGDSSNVAQHSPKKQEQDQIVNPSASIIWQIVIELLPLCDLPLKMKKKTKMKKTKNKNKKFFKFFFQIFRILFPFCHFQEGTPYQLEDIIQSRSDAFSTTLN
jgi:hypothetical protein